MTISYNKLWKLLIDLNMNKTQLRKTAGLSTNVIARLSKNASVSMDTLLRICEALHCNVGDIVEVTEKSDHLKKPEYTVAREASQLRVAENANVGYKSEPG